MSFSPHLEQIHEISGIAVILLRKPKISSLAAFWNVTIWRQAESLTVHLVNLNNPMMMKGPYRELVPAPAQRVRIQVPEGMRVERVQLLVSEQAIEAEEVEGYITVIVPAILDHEVIALDLALVN